MATTCGSAGIFGRFATEVSGSPAMGIFTGASPAWPLTQGGLTLSQKVTHVNPGESGSNGLTSEDAEQTREGLRMSDGDLNIAMTPAAWDYFAWRALGGNWGATAGGTTGVALTSFPDPAAPPSWHVLAHRDAKVYGYSTLMINQLSVSGTVGEFIKITMGTVGLDRMGINADTTWPAGLLTSASVPYMFEDCICTISAVAYKIRSFQYVRNNQLAPRYFGLRTPCGFTRNSKAVTTLKLVMAHADAEIAAIHQAAAPPAVLPIVLTFTHPTAGVSARITMPGCQVPQKDPAVGAGEILLDYDFVCRRAASQPECSFYSDPT